MAASSSDQLAPREQTIVLNVVSPSREEIPNKLTFSAIPVNTTIRALKEKIQELVPARPALSRQRLIYQGKVLASDQVILKDVFGQEVVNRSEPLSLHLVLSPLPSNARQQWTPPSLPQSNIFPNIGQSQQTTSQGVLPPDGQNSHPHHLPHQYNPRTFQPTLGPINPHQGPGPVPPHVQNAINQQLATVSQQLTAQLATHGAQAIQQGPPYSHFQPHQYQQPALSHPSFQQLVAQHQQARAAAGQHGLGQVQQNNENLNEQNRGSHDPYGFQPASSDDNAVVRENQGPTEENLRMAIQSTSTSRPDSRVDQRSHSRAPQGPSSLVDFNPSTHPYATTNAEPTSGNLPTHPITIPPATNFLIMLQQRLSVIETSLARGMAPPEAVFDHARAYLNNLASQPSSFPSSIESNLRTRLNNLSAQAQHLRASSTIPAPQAFVNQPATPEMTQGNPSAIAALARGGFQSGQPSATGAMDVNMPTPATPPASGSNHSLLSQTASSSQTQASAAPDIYLLSSPTGPHSLLISPSGLYTTSLAYPVNPAIHYMQPPNLNHVAVSQFVPPNQFSTAVPNQQAPPNFHNQAPGPPLPTNDLAQAQLRQQEQQNQARDLARILIPLGGHLWLLIRLFGFVYFFTAGGGHRRAILLGIGAFIVFIANTGAFRPLFRSLWQPVRRHVEGLIPLAAAGGGRDERQPRLNAQLPAQERVRDGAAAQDPNPTTNDNAPNTQRGPLRHDRRSNRSRNPTELADRLLRERHDQTIFRRVERAVALFLASLVPGVGERHIAARDAAEARRIEEERQREATAVREREEQEERDREKETVSGESLAAVPSAESSGNDILGDGGGGGEDGGGAGEGIRERGVEGRQQALVEI